MLFGLHPRWWLLLLALIIALSSTSISSQDTFDTFALWTDGTQLRGINIWQRVVIPEVDGDEFLGSGHVGPPYTQADFDRLAAMGANYVHISGPGLFTERPPYVLDEAVQANLDSILAMIEQADMFAVISLRTGPGRSDFTFYANEILECGCGDPSLLIDTVWEEQTAQDAWVAMWRYIALRYRDHPIVVGYELIVEPNAAGRLFSIIDPEIFYGQYTGTIHDWNQFYPRLVAAIREVDAETPILVAAEGWGRVRWLPYLQPVADSRVVYVVDQYEPEQYTQQPAPVTYTYPDSFDLNRDNVPDEFNVDWLDSFLSTIDDFQQAYDVPVAVSEFGVVRWAPGAADFVRDQMMLFEERGLNHALWVWNPAWPPYAEVDTFNFLHGSDPANHTAVESGDLIAIIRANWSQNTVRPSNVGN